MKYNERFKFTFNNRKIRFDPTLIQVPPLIDKDLLYINALALDVSGSCNMNCIYCAEKFTMPQRSPMSMDILHMAVDQIFDWSPKNNDISIHLGSGEPLLNPNAVHEISSRALKKAKIYGRQINLHITTNGTLINRKICYWLIRDGWRVKISIDGNLQTHDKNRRDKMGNSTFKKVEQIIRLLVKHIPDRLSTTSVLCHGADPGKIFSDIATLGVNKIEMVPVAMLYPSKLLLKKKDLVIYREFLFKYLQQIVKGIPVPLLTQFIKRLQRALGFGISKIKCGAGRNFLAIGSDGLIYPCFRFIGNKKFCLGSIDKGINFELTYKFQSGTGRPFDQRKKCKDCWAALLCGGPCFACVELLYKKNGEPSQDFCGMVIEESKAVIWLTQYLRKRNPKRLIDLLGVSLEDI